MLTKRQFHINLHKFTKAPHDISRGLRNDLEEVVSKEYPEIGVMKKMLCSAGALGALMSGSGPTVFGIFSEERGASEAYKKVRKMVKSKGWIVLDAHSIPVVKAGRQADEGLGGQGNVSHRYEAYALAPSQVQGKGALWK